jgi:hypothetical protein
VGDTEVDGEDSGAWRGAGKLERQLPSL